MPRAMHCQKRFVTITDLGRKDPVWLEPFHYITGEQSRLVSLFPLIIYCVQCCMQKSIGSFILAIVLAIYARHLLQSSSLAAVENLPFEPTMSISRGIAKKVLAIETPEVKTPIVFRLLAAQRHFFVGCWCPGATKHWVAFSQKSDTVFNGEREMAEFLCIFILTGVLVSLTTSMSPKEL